ncbi:unnamed protein product [Acanthoscelides obtectus]|uniref:Uncharacterized protein n=1 Tax=Acanthoscelides obtectus TaxID=200917 RepID=A0A9P0PJ63_ACAOB|nr:unnamed protein product [Acanthoscelides obtectus]CAK1649633.1 hypothetical protein AOBTE_LOCUS16338 [Acanthoscelides obtectus]
MENIAYPSVLAQKRVWELQPYVAAVDKWHRSENSVLKKSKNPWPSNLGGSSTGPTRTPSIIRTHMFTLYSCWKVLSRTA